MLIAMTPHCEDSMVKWFFERDFKVFMWPIRFPTPERYDKIRTWLAPSLRARIDNDPNLLRGGGEKGNEGQPINPWRLGEEFCRKKLKKVKHYEWNLQYELNMDAGSVAKPFLLADLIVMDVNRDMAPEKILHSNIEKWDLSADGIGEDAYYKPGAIVGLVPYERKVMAVDPAGITEDGDELAYAIGGRVAGYISVMDCSGLLGGYRTENLQTLARLAVRWRVDTIIVESNLGLGMFAELLRPVLNAEAELAGLVIGIENRPSKGSKEVRICDTTGPVVQDHRMIWDRRMVERDFLQRNPGIDAEEGRAYTLAYQFTRIDREPDNLPHDDRIDALNMLVTELEPGTGANHDEELLRRSEMSLETRLRKYEEWITDKNRRLFGKRTTPGGIRDFMR